MLQSLREKMAGPLAWFVVGLITIPFAFWGVDQFATGGSDPTLVRVGDQKITQAQFRAGYDRRYQQLVQMLGDSFQPDMIDQAGFRESVLQDMIQESMLRQYADDNGYRVGDESLLSFLRSVPAFQEDGRFSPSAYRAVLSRQGLSPEYYESQLRDGLAIEQLRSGIIDTAFTTDADRALAQRIAGQSRRFDYVRVPASRYLASVEVDESEARAVYDEQPQRFQRPERVRLSYIDLDLEQMMAADEPNEEVLKAIYQAERDGRFSRPETRRASHILKTGADARARIEALATQLAEGADFAELARQHSEDTGSATDGGELGWIERGQMVPAFETALFAMEAGQLSAPVETDFGWHLIQLDEVRERRTLAFEDESVQQDLLRLYRARESDLRFRELADVLEQVAFENAASLEPAAEATGLQVQQTDWLTRESSSDLFAHEQVRRAAFSREVLDGENSSLIGIGSSRVVVLRAQEYEPPRLREFDEVRERILGGLREQRASERAQEVASALAVAAREGGDFSAAVEAEGLRLESPGLVRRDADSVDRAIRGAAFAMPRPDETRRPVELVNLGASGTAVVVLHEVSEPDGDFNLRGTPFANLREDRAGAEFAAFTQHIENVVNVRRMTEPARPAEADFLD
jgi:peptidyl-prolyl cis-trans isomerase D